MTLFLDDNGNLASPRTLLFRNSLRDVRGGCPVIYWIYCDLWWVSCDFSLKEGVRISETLPEELVFDVSEDSGAMLTDFINNITSNLLVSASVKNYFENQELLDDQVEYLPFKIKNQRGRHPVPVLVMRILNHN